MPSVRLLVAGVVSILLACRPAEPPPPPPAPSPEAAPAEPSGPPLIFGLGLPLGVSANPEASSLIASFLTDQLKQPVQVRLFSYDELTKALAEGQVDIAFVSPVPYVKAAEQKPIRIVRRALHSGASSYASVIFVRGDSKARNLDELKGKKMAWVQEGSASGYLFPRAAMLNRKLKPEKFFSSEVFLQDHAKVCEAVLEGRADAGASFSDLRPDGSAPQPGTFGVDGCRVAKTAANQLRVVFSSQPIPNDVVVVRADAPESIDATLGVALDTIRNAPNGARTLQVGFLADGFIRGYDADFAPVRELLKAFEPAPATP